jgi:hypothetical protein
MILIFVFAFIFFYYYIYRLAEVVKLVDAHGSGPCGLKPVGVRLPPSAPIFFQPDKQSKSNH